jgi:thiol-disulfide isomerase/thioredoxin
MTVYGKVTGTDGKPMVMSRVFLTYPSDDNPVRSVAVGKDGKFRIEIESEGLWMLHFTGVFHHEYAVAIYADGSKEIQIDVRLEAYNYGTNFKRAAIIGNFNDWSLARAVKMKEDQHGTYSAIIDTKSDTVFYRLVNVCTGAFVEGTDADGFQPNGIEGYNSFLIPREGKVKIVLDPRKLLRFSQPSDFKLFVADSIESRFAKSFAIYEHTKQAYNSSLYWHVAEFKMGEFKFDFAPIIDSVRNLLNAEPEGLIRQVLQLDYFGLTAMSTFTHYVDVKTCRETLSGIPPNSIVWSLDPGLLSVALKQASYNQPQRKEYIGKVLDTNPMSRTKEVLLRDEIEWDFHSLDYVRIPRYLTTLLDQYGDSPEALTEGRIYSAEYLRVKRDANAPSFSVISLSDSAGSFTNDSFKGKYYLLDFWATWNKSSVDEIENLGKMCERYKNKGLEILSISLDSSAQVGHEFIQVKVGMPWFDAKADSGIGSKICRNFEVYSVPKAILVDPDGKILAAGWDLRGENLGKTLAKYLGK